MSQTEAANLLHRAELSPSLRGSLQRAMAYAFEQSHRQVTLEHLLLALAEDRESAVILDASAVDVPALMADVSGYLSRLDDRVAPGATPEPAIGGAVQHIFQSAAAAAQKSRRRSISSALVLAAIVGEGRSPAARMLRNRGLTFEHAIEALKRANAGDAGSPQQHSEPSPGPEAGLHSASPAIGPLAGAPAPTSSPRLQNVQAAHEIIAHARERIAQARGAIAATQPDTALDTPPPGPSAAQKPVSKDPAHSSRPPTPPRPAHQQPALPASRPPPPVPPVTARQDLPLRPPPPRPPQAASAGSQQHPSEWIAPPMPPAAYPGAPRLPSPKTQRLPAANSPPFQQPPGTSLASQHSAPATPIEPERLIEDIPDRMRLGAPATIVIQAPRARLEAWSGSGAPDQQIITKAMAMRLKAPDGGFTIEIASPETQWSEGVPGPLSDDVVSWRWIVTPTRSGRYPLQLLASTRIVGRDGLAAARSLPEQTVSVRVAPNYSRMAARLLVWIVVACSGAATGYYGEQLFRIGRSALAQVMQ